MPIYLDNAATSYPKPETVYLAVDRYQRENGAAAGRGGYRAAMEVQATLGRCRQSLAELFQAESPERVLFTFNGTDSLNLGLHGVLRPGSHVIASTLEHNSVLRPLRWLERQRGVEVTLIPPGPNGRVEPAEFRRAIRPETALITLIHASNVTGMIQPVAEVGEIARQAGVLFLVDAAQTTGHLPLDLRELGADLLACPGHKGLLGPLGTGVLYLRAGVEDRVDSFRQGGTGSRSEQDQQPELLPDKYEAGNHNTPGLVGLEAGLQFLKQRTVTAIHQHEQQLTAELLQGLWSLPGCEVYGPRELTHRLGVVSFNLTGLDPQILAGILDDSFSIQCRAGYHCAPRVHESLGTFETGGTVRFSVGPFTTSEDVRQALGAVGEIAGSL